MSPAKAWENMMVLRSAVRKLGRRRKPQWTGCSIRAATAKAQLPFPLSLSRGTLRTSIINLDVWTSVLQHPRDDLDWACAVGARGLKGVWSTFIIVCRGSRRGSTGVFLL